MKLAAIADSLWGNKARVSYLLLAAVILLFTCLGGREIWTQEHRWADIVSGMFYRNDFLHPYLGNSDYYDKPLLSYWLIALFAKLTSALTTWTLRLPSALAGLLTVASIYFLGKKIQDRHLGLLSGWLLLTTYYFVFWSRVSSADMLNLAGTVFAVAWYFNKREHARFWDYAVFFLVIALTSLCKGLVGAIVPLIAVLVDIILQKSWKQHLRLTLVWAVIPALLVYLSPFIASSYFGGDSFAQNGLYLVYRENILRYFQPFDHQGPIYTYFLYLPVYLLPWTIFFIPALLTLKSRWKNMTTDSRWVAWTLFVLFLFFTSSGSRRSYYVLPMVPFAVLFTADWILSGEPVLARKRLWSAGLIVIFFAALFAAVDVAPAWYYAKFGVNRFAVALQKEASRIKPWHVWNVVILDAESKMNFYLHLPPGAVKYHIKGTERINVPTSDQLLAMWPLLKNRDANTIYVSRKLYAPVLQHILAGYRTLEVAYPSLPFINKQDTDSPVAYIPAG
ncbi:Undecaprenyl phosphate-alpha-4-amino-4-deoxy-L-arabinose arabinosyl transferase [Aquicella siphonis]|uniref:Undecaprenyl phosphate-alpha-4-amino-4-deoxy-L-arabinose arabinosyl transferase n=1 Tax=Aquicella siphonis TaxID=254247 RepID=A0A5E4PIA9_9COXI|nr:glycosyltransferase family 39 protein [Aquicella siphonis]VVC76305.1 Undecaprenyl phosphate-alpha-4-amino-4-deoxy-L-arabinose arabinosyl transferase [Aquicella siphonis]